MVESKTGRSFQLSALLSSNSSDKVTIGFKATVSTKINLFKEAESLGLSLSEYIAALLEARHKSSQMGVIHGNSTSNLKLSEENVELKETIKGLKVEIEGLEDEVDYFLLHPKIDMLWEKYEGKTFDIIEEDGSKASITVDSSHDVYKIILSSFK